MAFYEEEIKLWDGLPPFSLPEDQQRKEYLTEQSADGIERLTNVSTPTLTFYPCSGGGPLEQRRHPAVLVCPGGAYSILAWNKEGRDICFMLNRNGFSAFLLKYRCPDRRDGAHADAARAIRLIRAKARDFGVDPQKVGAIGMSAGAHLCATITAPANDIPYPPKDNVDLQSFRPDFTAMIYPAYLSDDTLNLAPEFKVDADCPPCLLIQCENDPVHVENSIAWFLAMKRVERPVEMHIWPTGGHGFGLLKKNTPCDNCDKLAEEWFCRQIK